MKLVVSTGQSDKNNHYRYVSNYKCFLALKNIILGLRQYVLLGTANPSGRQPMLFV